MAEHVVAERGFAILHTGATMIFHQSINVHLSVTINSAVTNCSDKTLTNFND